MKAIKPPLGILPSYLYKGFGIDIRQRARDLASALDRYEKAGLNRKCQVHWENELEDILFGAGV